MDSCRYLPLLSWIFFKKFRNRKAVGRRKRVALTRSTTCFARRHAALLSSSHCSIKLHLNRTNFPTFKKGIGRRLRLRISSRTVETFICKRSATCSIVRIGSGFLGEAGAAGAATGLTGTTTDFLGIDTTVYLGAIAPCIRLCL